MLKEKIRTILVDDEEDAVNLLQQLLNDYPEIEVLAVAYNTFDAYKVILEYEPDLVFLDVQMPRETGIDLAGKLKALTSCPAIIFVTAYDQYAIAAIKNAALDYILKPVNRTELKNAIFRFKEMKSHNRSEMANKLNQLFAQIAHPNKLRFSTRTGFFMIDPEKIIFCKADGNYSEFYTTEGKKEIVTTNLGHIEENLPEHCFYRVSRSHIINLNFVNRINRKERFCEIGVNGTTFNLSVPKNKIRELEHKLTEYY